MYAITTRIPIQSLIGISLNNLISPGCIPSLSALHSSAMDLLDSGFPNVNASYGELIFTVWPFRIKQFLRKSACTSDFDDARCLVTGWYHNL